MILPFQTSKVSVLLAFTWEDIAGNHKEKKQISCLEKLCFKYLGINNFLHIYQMPAPFVTDLLPKSAYPIMPSPYCHSHPVNKQWVLTLWATVSHHFSSLEHMQSTFVENTRSFYVVTFSFWINRKIITDMCQVKWICINSEKNAKRRQGFIILSNSYRALSSCNKRFIVINYLLYWWS